jgi:hypothetical protein
MAKDVYWRAIGKDANKDFENLLEAECYQHSNEFILHNNIKLTEQQLEALNSEYTAS